MLQMVRRISAIAIAAAAIWGCNKYDFKGMFMPTGEGVQTRFEQSMKMNKDLYVGKVDTDEQYVFYSATDPHIDKTSRNLNTFNDALRNDEQAAFGVILGDCTDVRDNLPNYLDATVYDPDRHAYNHRLFHILGNHDVYFKGWADFKELIGPSVFWFEADFKNGMDLYISLDSATGTLGSKQTEWLKSFLTDKRENYRHCIILTHTNLFYTDNSQATSGNMPIEEVYLLLDLLGKHNVTLVLQGHDHYREDLTYDNVRYTVLGTIKDESNAPEYLKLNVSESGISFDWQIL